MSEQLRTEAGAELMYYVHGALIAYPEDRTEAIMRGVREYAVRIEREAAQLGPLGADSWTMSSANDAPEAPDDAR